MGGSDGGLLGGGLAGGIDGGAGGSEGGGGEQGGDGGGGNSGGSGGGSDGEGTGWITTHAHAAGSTRSLSHSLAVSEQGAVRSSSTDAWSKAVPVLKPSNDATSTTYAVSGASLSRATPSRTVCFRHSPMPAAVQRTLYPTTSALSLSVRAHSIPYGY